MGSEQEDVERWVRHVREEVSRDEFCLFLMICWGLWKNRNGVLMEGKHRHAEGLVGGVSCYLVEFQRASGSRRVGIRLGGVDSWKPPEAGWVKVNYDGALFADGKEGGAGVVARSETGECVAWVSYRFVKPIYPEEVEAMAAREAALLVVQHGWPAIILEGDCASLIHKLQARETNFSTIGQLTQDIKCIVARSSCVFPLVHRAGNKVAHCLAPAILSSELLKSKDGFKGTLPIKISGGGVAGAVPNNGSGGAAAQETDGCNGECDAAVAAGCCGGAAQVQGGGNEFSGVGIAGAVPIDDSGGVAAQETDGCNGECDAATAAGGCGGVAQVQSGGEERFQSSGDVGSFETATADGEWLSKSPSPITSVAVVGYGSDTFDSKTLGAAKGDRGDAN
ncbi:UNVERIFIED_CONTAM: hypothetical protein Scaly_2217400 [Sesamum calycinum]|uniref:RNase H type-1 domain-containing protein n=1 Tax=Sesamum calycinum TaxID=2727403 RepID=A0AAW2MBS0_9LAMI